MDHPPTACRSFAPPPPADALADPAAAFPGTPVHELPLRNAAGTLSAVVAAAELAPGLHAHFARRGCDCETCADWDTHPDTCPNATALWTLTTAAGLAACVDHHPLTAVQARQVAADLAATVPVDFTDPDPARQFTAARTETARQAYRAVARRFYGLPDPEPLFLVTCPACPDLDAARPAGAAADVAGCHDDDHHHGRPTAHVHPLPGGPA